MSWFIGCFWSRWKYFMLCSQLKQCFRLIFNGNLKLFVKKLPEFNSKLHRLDYWGELTAKHVNQWTKHVNITSFTSCCQGVARLVIKMFTTQTPSQSLAVQVGKIAYSNACLASVLLFQRCNLIIYLSGFAIFWTFEMTGVWSWTSAYSERTLHQRICCLCKSWK